MIRHGLRVMKALLAITVAEFAEYRAVVFIWIMAGSLPLIMMFVWTSAAGDGAVAGHSAADFSRYFMLAFLTGQLTQVWVIWALDEEIRLGRMSMQLIRPFDPYLTQAVHNWTAIGMRFPIVLAITAIGLGLTGTLGDLAFTRLPLFLLAIVGAWLIAFNLNYAMGLLTFWTDRAIALESWYYLAGSVLSGGLFPLDLLPPTVQRLVSFTPFPYIIGFPIEIMTGKLTLPDILTDLALQLLWAALFIGAHRLLWRAGLRRYGAVGA
jgi:ABC-2 type transport system permease protein